MDFVDGVVTQQVFADLVGITQPAVSDLVTRGVLVAGDAFTAWLRSYTAHLRAQAAGRDADGSLARERALLSRSQREGQELKNAVTRGEYAPIGLLGDVLAMASAAVVDRFDALPGQLRKACPDLPAEARDAVNKTIASARNEWIRQTTTLVVRQLDAMLVHDDKDEPVGSEADDEAFADDDDVSP